MTDFATEYASFGAPTLIMTEENLVSIVTIFLNAEAFLHDAIQSVLDQSYSNWELLLVDDGSSDESPQIAKDLATRHPGRIHYLEHPLHENRGMSESRNLGISHAKGEMIALLDADDAWFPQKLDQQVQILSEMPEAGMLYGRHQFWKSWTGSPVDQDSLAIHQIQMDKLYKAPELLILIYGLSKSSLPCPSDLLFRRSAALRIGGFENQFKGMYEDQVFLIKVFLRENVFVSDHVWTRYRQHSESCVSTSLDSDSNESILVFLRWFKQTVIQEGMQDTIVEKEIRRRMNMLREPRFPMLRKISRKLRRAK